MNESSGSVCNFNLHLTRHLRLIIMQRCVHSSCPFLRLLLLLRCFFFLLRNLDYYGSNGDSSRSTCMKQQTQYSCSHTMCIFVYGFVSRYFFIWSLMLPFVDECCCCCCCCLLAVFVLCCFFFVLVECIRYFVNLLCDTVIS